MDLNLIDFDLLKNIYITKLSSIFANYIRNNCKDFLSFFFKTFNMKYEQKFNYILLQNLFQKNNKIQIVLKKSYFKALGHGQ